MKTKNAVVIGIVLTSKYGVKIENVHEDAWALALKNKCRVSYWHNEKYVSIEPDEWETVDLVDT